MYKILLVEDDAWLADLYKDILATDANVNVVVASNSADALAQLDAHSDVDLVLLDMFLPDHNGIEFLHEMASYSDINHLPVIILSSVYQHDFAMSDERWRHYGVVNYLYKPRTKPADLLAAVKKQLSVVGAKR